MSIPRRIVHVSTSDVGGGAARAAYRLHTGLRGIGQDSSMFVAERLSRDPSVQRWLCGPDKAAEHRSSPPLARVPRSLAHHLSSRPPGFEFFSDDRHPHGANQVAQLPQADVINLHWVARFIDYRSFFSAVPRHTHVVWTLHDMNPFTGGCHYDAGCRKYTRHCGACPQLTSDVPVDLSRRIWGRKRACYEMLSGRLNIVTPSRWLAEEARRSTLFGGFPVSVIPYGLDVDVFAPRDRGFAREVMGIPQDAVVILFVADWPRIHRKGITLLVDALQERRTLRKLFLVSVGREVSVPQGILAFRHRHVGRVDHDRFLSIIYSAADVFAIPSRQDNLPNTVLEAMACGTPVVGFDVGGIPDMVRPGTTGLLAPAGDAATLGDAIAQILQDDERRAEMSANCRRIVVEEYSLSAQARRYLDLYRQVCSSR